MQKAVLLFRSLLFAVLLLFFTAKGPESISKLLSESSHVSPLTLARLPGPVLGHLVAVVAK